MRTASDVRDDVYHTPSSAPPLASSKKTKAQEAEKPAAVDDYYDPGTAQRYAAPRSYYDMAYNDPHYYNYGRFGFGMGSGMGMGMGMPTGMGMMGWQSGWNGPGWGMGMGYGWGGGMGWNDPWMRMNHGWGNPWGMGMHNRWGSPWMNSPWGWDPYFGGWGGFGNYWGPMGNCFSCYNPPFGVGVPRNPTVFQHRTPFGGGVRPGSRDPGRSLLRDPGTPSPRLGTDPSRSTGRPAIQGQPAPDIDRGTRPGGRPGSLSPGRQPTESRPSPRPGRDSGGGTFDRGGGFDRGSAPSRPGSFGGGGSRPSATPGPR